MHVVLEAQLGGFAERARLGEERRRAGDVAAPQKETRRLRRARLGSHSAQARHFAVHAVPHRQSQRVPVSSSLSEPRDGVSDRIASLERASQVERGRGEDVFAARTRKETSAFAFFFNRRSRSAALRRRLLLGAPHRLLGAREVSRGAQRARRV